MAKAVAIDNPDDKRRGSFGRDAKVPGEKPTAAITGQWERMTGFLADVRNEMRKVSTPSRQEVQTTTLVVVATVFAFAAYFYVIDRIIGTGLDAMLRKLASH